MTKWICSGCKPMNRPGAIACPNCCGFTQLTNPAPSTGAAATPTA